MKDRKSVINRKNERRITNEKVFFDENENINEFRLVSEFDNEDNRSNKKFPKPDIDKESKMNGNRSNFKKIPSEEIAQLDKISFILE